MSVSPGSGIVRLGLGVAQGYLVDLDDGLHLVDTGTPGNADRVLAAIRDGGRTPADLRGIVLTHQHADHAGSVAALARATGAPVHVHAADAATVRDGLVPAVGTSSLEIPGLGGLMARFIPSRPLEAAPVTRELADGDRVGGPAGLRVIHTPGHTPGHASYLLERHGGTLFVGDAAAHLFGRVRRPVVATDWAAVARSAALLAALEFDTALFGHGAPIRGGALAAIRRYAERLARTAARC